MHAVLALRHDMQPSNSLRRFGQEMRKARADDIHALGLCLRKPLAYAARTYLRDDAHAGRRSAEE